MMSPHLPHSNINLFIRQDGRLLSPFISVIATDDNIESVAHGLVTVATVQWKDYFDVSQVSDLIDSVILGGWKTGKMCDEKGGIEFIAIKSDMNVHPEQLVERHKLAVHTPPPFFLSGAGKEVLRQLFWSGPVSVSDVSSDAGKDELESYSLCETHVINDVVHLMLSVPGYKYALDHLIFRTGRTPPIGLSL